jgi:hypothetical protein
MEPQSEQPGFFLPLNKATMRLLITIRAIRKTANTTNNCMSITGIESQRYKAILDNFER